MGSEPRAWTVPEVYRLHADFVWKTLARFGVPDRDRPDQVQEVFVVVHRRLATFRNEGEMTSWLFSIARRVAAAYRRRAYRVKETVTAEPEAQIAASDCPENDAAMRHARAQMETILDRMSIDQRAVFVMFEIDGMTGQEIAALMECPLQTVFSRLRRAREVFERHVARMRALEERRAG
jgi:RNA polymerase sigma-70 factor (ECF subfamily)